MPRRVFEDTKRCWLDAAGIQHLSLPGSGESLLPCRSHPLVCPSAATEIPPCCTPMVGAVSVLFLLDINGRVLEKHLGAGSSFCESYVVAASTLLPSPEEEPGSSSAGGHGVCSRGGGTSLPATARLSSFLLSSLSVAWQ
jgi:hypothetical protein